MTLTEFVGRLRVEKAKQFLLNPSLSVTEIAFSVGFNSLSQFNRVFLRYVGKAPTKFRKGGEGNGVGAGSPTVEIAEPRSTMGEVC
jgi:AraC-like DNA-binding protein